MILNAFSAPFICAFVSIVVVSLWFEKGDVRGVAAQILAIARGGGFSNIPSRSGVAYLTNVQQAFAAVASTTTTGIPQCVVMVFSTLLVPFAVILLYKLLQRVGPQGTKAAISW